MNKIEQKINATLPESNFPVVGSFIERTQASLELQRVIRPALASGNDGFLTEQGFPEDCIPVMRLWMDQGPTILSSFSHPEELDLDKVTATLNLGLFASRLRASGDEVRVLVSEYDTVPLQKSAKKPFAIGNFGLDMDLFGIRQDTTSNRVLKDEERAAILERGNALSGDGPKSPAAVLLDSLRNSLVDEINKKGLASQKKKFTDVSRELIRRRFEEIASCVEASAVNSDQTIAQVLSGFNAELQNLIFGFPTSSDEYFGLERKILSDNTDFLGLVSESVQMLVESRGVDFLKDIIKPGEGIAVMVQDGKRAILTKDSEGFAVDVAGEKFGIDPENVVSFIQGGLPLAKLESLALYAGGMTMHMGSEYGVRAKVLDALGYKGRAYDYVMGLRISDDKKHGNLGIVVEPGGYIPSPLAYVLFGRKNMNKLVMAQAGKTCDPVTLSIADLKEVAADSLILEALSQMGGIEGE